MAQIILDWDDGEWYVSDIIYTGEETDPELNIINSISSKQQQTGTKQVKLAEWTEDYSYGKNDIVSYKGKLYRADQDNNKGFEPDKDNFWWKKLYDLDNIDALYLEGKSFEDIKKEVLSGYNISDFALLKEVKDLILAYINQVDAIMLNGKKLSEIYEEINSRISTAKSEAINESTDYFLNEKYQTELIDFFNENILPDNINKG